jgi:Holliday junction resolvase
MTPEKQFETNLIKQLRIAGAFAHHFDVVGCDGWPDILVLKNNECVLLECKYHTTELRDEQYAFHELLKAKYGFNRIYIVSKMSDENYCLIDSCFKSNEYRFSSVTKLARAIDKELGDDRILVETSGTGTR